MKEQWDSMKSMLRKKPIKKLCLIGALVLVVLAFAVYFSAYLTSVLRQANLMGHHLSSFPQVYDERIEELTVREDAYEKDYQIRADLGAKLYEYENESDRTIERLDAVRETISATCAALTDGSGNLLTVTSSDDRAMLTPDAVAELQKEGIYACIFDEQKGEYLENPRVFLLRRLPGGGNQSLIFSFDCSPVVEMQKEIGEWDDVLDRMLSGLNCTAYIQDAETGGLGRYPHTELSAEDSDRLAEEIGALFADTDGYVPVEFEEGNTALLNNASILGRKHLIMKKTFQDQQNVSIILTNEVSAHVRQAMLGVGAFLVLAALGMVLYAVYAVRRMRGAQLPEDEKSRRRKARLMTLPGLAIFLAVTVGFLIMISLLESKASTAGIVMNQKRSLEAEIDYHEAQDKLFRTELPNMVRIRADALAHILSDSPELRTRQSLQEFCGAVQADYLMLFDREGRELCSSNSLTGLQVTNEKDDPLNAYHPLVIGYANVITEPAEDPYSGKVEYSVGSLIRDQEGLPDGFILVVVPAEELSSMLDSFTPARTVDSFAVLQGQTAALADVGTGCFAAHTRPEMIGMPVSSVMSDTILGSFFEGFTKYDGHSVYLSASTEDGKTLMLFWEGGTEAIAGMETVIMILMYAAVVLLLGVVYFRCAAALTAQAVSEDGDSPRPEGKTALGVFFNGYGIFMCLFAFYAGIMANSGQWPAFAFVFDWKWSRGVHLFSIWAAILILAGGFYLTALLHKLLGMLDRYTDHRTKTVMRLVDSLVSYTAVILLLALTLYLFGVDTAAMLASAGIVSIAVGMGARDLVTDILAGVFMLLEGSLHVGDTVQVGGWEGKVTDMGIRTTRITNADGEVKILNNSHISDVVNKNCEQA